MTNFSSEQAWMEKFFSAPNTLVWSDLLSGQIVDRLSDEIQEWLRFFVDTENCPLVLLPKIILKQTIWYACSHNVRQAAQVAEEVSAMVSHAYAEVEYPLEMDLSDPCEAVLDDRFGSSVCRITVYSGQEDDVIRAVGTYRQLISKRPIRPQIGIRPPGKIRGLFDRALLARNFDEARKCITELQSSGRLDLQNQRFLEIRLLAVQEKWDKIVGDPTYLRSVVDLELPSRILADLVEAVYQVFLRKYEEALDLQGAISEFKEVVMHKYGRLFRARKGLATPSVLKSFLLAQLCYKQPELGLCQKLVDDYPVDQPGIEFIQNLFCEVPRKPSEKVVLDRAKEAFDEDKVEQALELYASCPPAPDVLAMVLRCSRDVEAMSDLKVAWEYCLECPEEWFEGLTPKQIKAYNSLAEACTLQSINGWSEWVAFVLEGGDLNEAEKLAQSGVVKWSLESFLAEEDSVERFCSLLYDGVDQYPDFFQRQFAYIYEFAVSDSKSNSQLRPLYSVLLELLACSEAVGESDLILAQELIRSLFEFGISTENYSEILGIVELLWSATRSFKYLDWALDMSELLAINPAPMPELRSRFFNNVLGHIATNPQRIDPPTWLALELLSEDYDSVDFVQNLKPLEQDVKGGETENSLFGKKVGIYSLTEQSAIRAKQLLESLCPGIIVEVNHDHAASPALKNLARSSDLFVFAWRSSKHQAYYCVKKIVPKDRLLLPLGKGSTSIVNCILERESLFFGQ